MAFSKKFANKFYDAEEKGAEQGMIGHFDPHDHQKNLRKRRDDTTTIGHFALKFPIQQKLKIQDQG